MDIDFSLDDILDYFLHKGGKVVYTELVTHFKNALSNPETQANARIIFKNYVNQLATVTIREDGKKFLLLRAKYMKACTTEQPSSICRGTNSNDNDIDAENVDDGDSASAPQPPPRRKNSNGANVNNTCTAVNQHQQQLQQPTNDIGVVEETPFESKCANTVKQEIQELVRTPGRVKEHAQILNKLALDTHKLPMPSTANNQQVVTQKIRNTGGTHSDTDSGSVHLTDPLKKRWVLACSDCDYQEMLSLLKQDPELCHYRDTIMGYTALHWAAKFNKPEVIKLIAGNYNVDPNIKSFSGSTPLHIAIQFQNQDIMKILVYHYGANKEIRDNYGKKPYHYLSKKPNGCDPLNGQLFGNAGNRPTALGTENSYNASNTNVANQNSVPVQTSTGTDNMKNNLRNKISHQSMLVRNKLRNTAFKRRKSMNEKSKQRKNHQRTDS